jgi:hypothetical protein
MRMVATEGTVAQESLRNINRLANHEKMGGLF